jgi:cardiolipin synthase
MTDTFFAAIGAAQRELLAVTPYLVPTPDILRAFRVAALRGVDVRLILPQKSNHVYAGMAGRALYDDLLAAGVRIYERPPPFLHAKALIVDNALAIVGTANLDVRSLRLNYETNIAVFDEAFVGELKRIVLEDLAASRELELARWRQRPAVQRALENACSLLTPIL